MLGWSDGSWRDIGHIEPLMVTAFGSQSLPDVDSPAWEKIGKRWPVADDEPAWRHAGFQPVNWAERGVGLPSSYQSLDDYVEASQEYQAGLVRYAAEHMRTRKFESCWGAFAYHLVDPFPGIGFGLLDGTRRPKLALEALAIAFKPTRVIIEPLVFEGARPFGVLQNPRVPFAARLVVVNDDPSVMGRGVIRWSVAREKAAGARGLDRMRDVVQKNTSIDTRRALVMLSTPPPTVMAPVPVAGICPASRTAKDWRVRARRQQENSVLTKMVHASMSPKNR